GPHPQPADGLAACPNPRRHARRRRPSPRPPRGPRAAGPDRAGRARLAERQVPARQHGWRIGERVPSHADPAGPAGGPRWRSERDAMTTPDATTGAATFPTDITGLDESAASTVGDVADGETL